MKIKLVTKLVVEYICGMTFTQRLMRYLIGIIIGLVVVAIMFPNRDWLNWTPQSRMMQDIREFEIQIAPEAACSMQCEQITAEHLQNARKHGRVNFEKSNPQIEPKLYHLDYGDVGYTLALSDSTFTLNAVQRIHTNCTCP
jgi:hypothetical protein